MNKQHNLSLKKLASYMRSALSIIFCCRFVLFENEVYSLLYVYFTPTKKDKLGAYLARDFRHSYLRPGLVTLRLSATHSSAAKQFKTVFLINLAMDLKQMIGPQMIGTVEAQAYRGLI